MSFQIKSYEYAVLLIGLTLISWFVACWSIAPDLRKLKNKVTLNLEQLLDTVGNGDLIFLSGESQGERAIKLAHNSYYSHVCIVFTDERGAVDASKLNTVFVLESDLGQGSKEGPRVMKLYDKLTRWSKNTTDKIGMIRRYISLKRPKTEDILHIARSYIDSGIGMDITMTSWFLSDFPDSTAFQKLKKNNMFCSELVADALARLDIIKLDHHPSWYTPEHFASGKRIRMNIKKGAYGMNLYFSF